MDGTKTNSKSKSCRIVEIHDHEHFNLVKEGEENMKNNPGEQIAKNLEGMEYQIAKLIEDRLLVKRKFDLKKRKNDKDKCGKITERN